jgi:aerobic-type carbon monoxide dehydrogenase small subunit (CoxS/CutS family)
MEQAMKISKIKIKVNGEWNELTVPNQKTLLEVIREDLHLTGTKKMCNSGECGGCTVIMDGMVVNSCIVLAVDANGKEIVTIEGLAPIGKLQPIQEEFIARGAIQCGFCTPGMILSAKALLDQNPNPTEFEVKKAISGNFCRCTGYVRIVDAILSAAERLRSENDEGI